MMWAGSPASVGLVDVVVCYGMGWDVSRCTSRAFVLTTGFLHEGGDLMGEFVSAERRVPVKDT